MLSSQNRYIALDFETTGLDLNKDEIIQVGIVEMDQNWTIIKEFSSLIKPQKEIKELKQIVWFITGISLSKLETAPHIEDLQEEIIQFFGGNSYIIGHNIEFDLNFLTKHFPNLNIKWSIDTFLRSKNFIHFAPSYALEVLVEYLFNKEKEFQKLAQQFELDKNIKEDNFHDALVDSKNSLLLFQYLTSYITKLIHNYPLLQKIINKHNHNIFQELFDPNLFIHQNNVSSKEIPVLEKLAPKNTKLHIKDGIEIKQLVNKKRYYIGNETFEHSIQKLTQSKQNILAFSSRQKLEIAKHYLQKLWLKNIGFAKEEHSINLPVLKSFLQKDCFTTNELLFILKYFSHHYKNIWFLDLNEKKDYEIYYFLKDSKTAVSYPLVLTTHWWLFSIINNPESSYYHYNISFFDSEQRYKSYNYYLSRPCDLYQTLNFLETLIYTYNTRNQIKLWKYTKAIETLIDFSQFFQIFMWTIFSESTKLFTKTQANRIEYNPIIDNYNFHKTSILRPKYTQHLQQLQQTLLEEDYKLLKKHITHIEFILNTLVTINKRTHNKNGDFYFTFQETNKFTNWDEFTDIFEDRQVIFLSHSDTQYPKITNTKEDFNLPYELLTIANQNQIINTITSLLQHEKKQSIFILSSKKTESQDLFHKILKQDFQNQTNIIAENITWGVGKSVFKCKAQENNIIIGSYNFLMRMFAKEKPIDIVINFNIKWALEQFFLDDLRRYAPQKN